MHHLIISFIPFVFLSLLVTPTTNKTWTGREDSRWSNPNNWDPPGIPMPGDNINIPQGSPDCNVDCSGLCGNLENHGHLNIDEGKNLECEGNMNNNGQLNIGRDAGLEFRDGENSGDINIDKKGLMHGRNEFTNQGSGSVNLNGYGAEAEVDGYTQNNGELNFNDTDGKFTTGNMDNNGNIRSPERPDEDFNTNDINIKCRGNFNNNGQIDGGQYSANVNIKADNFNNNSGGVVKGGDGFDGGNVNIRAASVNNRGIIQGGNGAWNGGKVFIDANRFKNYQGSVTRGGEGIGGSVIVVGKEVVENAGGVVVGGAYSKAGGSVYMFSDSLYVSMSSPMDSVVSQGFLTEIRGRAVVVDTLSHPRCFYQPRIVIITTNDGFIDFSNVTTHWAVFSSYADSEYVMISNDRRLPDSSYEVFAFGITPEDTMDADTSINLLAMLRNLEVTRIYSTYDTSGSTDSIQMTLTNLSLGRYTLHYRINSDRGWVTPIEDSVTLSPFEESNPFALIYHLPYIPPDTLFEDIVHRTVWIVNPVSLEIETVFIDNYRIYGAQSEFYFSVDERDPEVKAPDARFMVFPNPFNEFTSIKFERESDFSIRIYDVTGKMIHSKEGINGTYLWKPPKTLPSGRYFLIVPGYPVRRTLLLVR